MPNIVDKINVGGEEYHLEPPMDAVPTQGSHNAVQSGGVYDALAGIAISPTPAEGETKAFSTGGAYDYFKTSDSKEWLIRAFANQLGQKWVRSESSEAAGYDYTDTVVTENGVFFTIPYLNQTLMKSLDGMNWEATNLTGLTGTVMESAVYFKGLYIVSTRGSYNTYVSEDLNDFTLLFNSSFDWYYSTADILIIATSGKLRYTTDGMNWHDCALAGGGTVPSGKIAYFNGVIAVQYSGAGGIVYTSSDGITYNKITYNSTSTRGRGIVATPEAFYAAGSNSGTSYIYRSTDGANWTDTGYTRLFKSSADTAQSMLLGAGNFLYVETADKGSDVLFADNANVILGPTQLYGAPYKVTTASIQVQTVKYMDGLYFASGGYMYNMISTDGVNFRRFYPTNVTKGRAALYHGILVQGGYYSSVFDPRCIYN